MAVEPTDSTNQPVPAPPTKAGATRKAPAADPAPTASEAPKAAPKARAAGRTVKEEAKKATRDATAAVRQEAGSLKRKASDKAHALADQGKAAATQKLDDFSRMIDDAAAEVDDRLGAQYGDYARSAADAVAGFASALRGKEVDDLVADARDFVKKSPVVAVGAAAAIGFVLARLVKAGIDAADRASDADADDPRA